MNNTDTKTPLVAPAKLYSQEIHANVAKILAREQITITFGNYPTAGFEVATRQLLLPDWKDAPDVVYSLFIGHEVGHALYTTAILYDKMKSASDSIYKNIINIVEDVRIEKLIQKKYSGLVPVFRLGYKVLLKDNFFDDYKNRVQTGPFLDKLNLHFKIGKYNGVEVPFNDTELQYVQMVDSCKTEDDVIVVADFLYALYQESLKKEQSANKVKQEKSDSPTNNEDRFPGDSDSDNEDSESVGCSEEKSDKGEDKISGDSEDSEAEAGDPDSSEDNGKAEGSDEKPKANDSKTPDEKSDSPKNSSEEKPKAKPEKSGEPEAKSKPKADSQDDNGSDKKAKAKKDAPQAKSEELSSKDFDCQSQENIDNSISEYNKDSYKTSTWDKRELYVIKYDQELEKTLLNNIVVPTNEDFEYIASSTDKYSNAYKSLEDFEKFKRASTSTIAALSQKFEMKKRAASHRKAQVSKSGTIDTNKLYQYKFSEDIFKRSISVPDGKNHAMLFVLDLSSSMAGNISEVISQLLILTGFCKKVNVPFEVYGFTNKLTHSPIRNFPSPFGVETAGLYSNGNNYCIVKLLDNKLSVKDYEYRSKLLYTRAINFLGYSTPLNQTIISSIAIHNRLKAQTRADIVNTIFLTDGQNMGELFDASKNYSATEGFTFVDKKTNKKYVFSVDNLKKNGTMYVTPESGADLATNFLLRVYRDMTKSKTIGFFVTNQDHLVRSALDEDRCLNKDTTTGDYYARRLAYKAAKKAYRSVEFRKAFSGFNGYDEMYYVSSKILNFTKVEKEIDVTKTVGLSTSNKLSLLKKSIKKGKYNTVLTDKIAEFLA